MSSLPKNRIYFLGSPSSGKELVLNACVKKPSLEIKTPQTLEIENRYYSASISCILDESEYKDIDFTWDAGFVFCININNLQGEFNAIKPIISSIPESNDPLIVVMCVTRAAKDSSHVGEYPLPHGDWWIEHGIGRISCVFDEAGAEIPIQVDPDEGAEGIAGLLELIECHQWPETQLKRSTKRTLPLPPEGSLSTDIPHPEISGLSTSSSSSSSSTTMSSSSSSSSSSSTSTSAKDDDDASPSSPHPHVSKYPPASIAAQAAIDARLAAAKQGEAQKADSEQGTSSNTPTTTTSSSSTTAASTPAATEEDPRKAMLEAEVNSFYTMGKRQLAAKISAEMKLKGVVQPLHTAGGLMEAMAAIKAHSASLEREQRHKFATMVAILMDMVLSEPEPDQSMMEEEEEHEPELSELIPDGD